jgi:hypothetical protein
MLVKVNPQYIHDTVLFAIASFLSQFLHAQSNYKLAIAHRSLFKNSNQNRKPSTGGFVGFD